MDEDEFLLFSRCLPEDTDLGMQKHPGELPFVNSVPSPVESVVSSTESDEGDYLLGLSKLMAHSALQNDAEYVAHKKFWEMGRTPLRSARSWSQPSSPPRTALDQKNDWTELLYAANSQLAGMKICDEGSVMLRGGSFEPPKKSGMVGSSESGMPMERSDFRCHPPLRRCWNGKDGDYSAISLQPQFFSRAATDVQNGSAVHSPSSTWPPSQRETPNGGMRTIFLGGSGSRRESSGTGVFIPRTGGNPSGFRKKSGVSTVLLPAKVVQALNLNVDDHGAAQPSYYLWKLVHGHDPSINIHLQPIVSPRNGFLPPQKRFVRPQPPGVSNELLLPQEWTY